MQKDLGDDYQFDVDFSEFNPLNVVPFWFVLKYNANNVQTSPKWQKPTFNQFWQSFSLKICTILSQSMYKSLPKNKQKIMK